MPSTLCYLAAAALLPRYRSAQGGQPPSANTRAGSRSPTHGRDCIRRRQNVKLRSCTADCFDNMQAPPYSNRCMQIMVRLAGSLAERAGAPRIAVELPEPATVAAIISELQRLHPQIGSVAASAIAVVAGRHASPDDVVNSSQEIALLLPVAGGSQKLFRVR